MGEFTGAPPVAYSKKLARQVGPDGAILMGFLLLKWLSTRSIKIEKLASNKELEEVAGLGVGVPTIIKKCQEKEFIVDGKLNIKKIEELLKCQLRKSLKEWKNLKRTLPEFPDTFCFHPVEGNRKFYYHCKIPLYQKL